MVIFYADEQFPRDVTVYLRSHSVSKERSASFEYTGDLPEDTVEHE